MWWDHRECKFSLLMHDDVIKWKHFPRYWPFVRGFHRSPVNSPLKGQWRGALVFSLICAWSLNKRLSKQSWSWWFETLWHPLWRHCNGLVYLRTVVSGDRSGGTKCVRPLLPIVSEWHQVGLLWIHLNSAVAPAWTPVTSRDSGIAPAQRATVPQSQYCDCCVTLAEEQSYAWLELIII